MRSDEKKYALTQEAKSLYVRYDEWPELAQLFAETQKKNPKSKLGSTNTPLTEADFNHCVDLLPQKKDHDDLPNITFDGANIQHPGYHIVKLPINDPRAFILGKITYCCQSINGYAQQCVIDGWTQPNSGFYVLLKANNKNKKSPVFKADGSINYDDYHIVGQTFAWASIYGNLVFYAWIFLKHETEKLNKTKLLEGYSEKIVAESNTVYRVMMGRNPHIPSPNEFITNNIESEMLFTGRSHQESIKQIQIACTDIPSWKHKIETAVEKLPLHIENIEQKKLLFVYAPPCKRYVDLLNDCANNPFLFDRLKIALNDADTKKQIMLLKQLTALYISFPIPIIQKTFHFLDKVAIAKKYIKTIDTDAVYLAQTLILLEKEPLLPAAIINIIHDELTKDSDELSILSINKIAHFLKALQKEGFEITEYLYQYALESLRYMPTASFEIHEGYRYEKEERTQYLPFAFFIHQLNTLKNTGFELTPNILMYMSKLNIMAIYEFKAIHTIDEIQQKNDIDILKLKSLIDNNIEINQISLYCLLIATRYERNIEETIFILKKIKGISFDGDEAFKSCFKAVLRRTKDNNYSELDCFVFLEKMHVRLNKETLAKIELDYEKKLLPKIKEEFDSENQAKQREFMQLYSDGSRLFNIARPKTPDDHEQLITQDKLMQKK